MNIADSDNGLWKRKKTLAKSAIYITLPCIIVLVLSTKGIMDEGIVSLNGDMPRYLMNGVYFHDLIDDMPITDPFEHAYRYFARYPALSLGHHPLLLGIAEAPFYAIFGVSVFSARLTIVFFMLLAVIAWFLLVRSVYDENIAFLSSLLFITTPFIVKYSRIVMSEIPTLALIILAAYFFYKYCETDKKKHAYATAVSLALSVYAKHTAVFIFPVLLAYLIMRKGAKRLIKKEFIVSYTIILVLILPLIPITLKFSQVNVAGVLNKTLDYRFSLSNLSYYIIVLWKHHLTLPVLILSLSSIFVSVYRKDGRATIFLFWIACSYLLITYLGSQIPRYAIYWIPAFCLFAATTINLFQYHALRVLVSTMLFLIAGYQFVYAFKAEPEYAYGYEQAARYVVENKTGESVLYGGWNASSYFIFFVRKHDPARDLIVLRANKILATSKMKRIVEERITKREEIYEALKNYGVQFVVIEDIESDSRALAWLREEVKSDKFILRKRISLKSNRSYIDKVPLYIYEYKEYMSPKDDVILQMNIPVMGDSIKIPFKDLIKKN
jgi:hypothetical protein